VALILGVLVLSVALPLSLGAQGRGDRRRQPPPPPRHATVVLRGHVFIGGYFFDPYFGPYPWWSRRVYPYWYFPVYDRRAEVRLMVMPRDTAVYVDGFYAGIVDDFDGVFESLPLPPGGHNIVLYREGYRTAYHNAYLRPGSTFRLRDTLERLPPGMRSEPPPFAPPVPPPPHGSYTTPRTPPSAPLPQATVPREPTSAPAGFATFDLRVQPVDAEVTIDGQRWMSSEEGHFVLQVPAGMHRVEVTKAGYRGFSNEVEVRDGETTPLNVSLMAPAR
jgi:hypothetical protein